MPLLNGSNGGPREKIFGIGKRKAFGISGCSKKYAAEFVNLTSLTFCKNARFLILTADDVGRWQHMNLFIRFRLSLTH